MAEKINSTLTPLTNKKFDEEENKKNNGQPISNGRTHNEKVQERYSKEEEVRTRVLPRVKASDQQVIFFLFLRR